MAYKVYNTYFVKKEKEMENLTVKECV